MGVQEVVSLRDAGQETLTPARTVSIPPTHVAWCAPSSPRGWGGGGGTRVPALSPTCRHKEPGFQHHFLGLLARMGGGWTRMARINYSVSSAPGAMVGSSWAPGDE